MFLAAGDLQDTSHVLVLLCPRQRLAVSCLVKSLTLELPHFGTILLLLAKIILFKWSVRLLEHFHVCLVVTFEFITILLLLARWLLLLLLLLS